MQLTKMENLHGQVDIICVIRLIEYYGLGTCNRCQRVKLRKIKLVGLEEHSYGQRKMTTNCRAIQNLVNGLQRRISNTVMSKHLCKL